MEGFNLEKWNELYDKGLEGYYYESIGEIEKSILVFEYVIENGSNIPLHFDRLRIIYNRQKKYDDCYRICKKYLIGNLISDKHPSILSLIYGYENATITDETNGLINDGHFSEQGNKILSDLFHQHILKYKNNE